MTTATATGPRTATTNPTATPPPLTEAVIRAAIVEGLAGQGVDVDECDPLIEALRPIFDSDMARVRIGWDPEYFGTEGHPGTLWADMRPEEYAELQSSVQKVIDDACRDATTAIVDGVARATAAFAAAHPDIPRGEYPTAPLSVASRKAARRG